MTRVARAAQASLSTGARVAAAGGRRYLGVVGMRITVLASGSGGNATLVEAGGTTLLLDAGLPVALLAERAREVLGGLPSRLDAILVTHAHGDHSGHAGACGLAFDAPVYMTQATRRGLRLPGGTKTRVFGSRTPFVVGAVTVSPLPVPHDAPQVALVLEHGGARAAMATDLGTVRPELVRHLRGAGVVLLESNHDPEMLAGGPYPPRLRQRVASKRGHLSNAQAAALLSQLDASTETVVLMHLSETNNRAELARGCAEEALRGRSTRLLLAHQSRPLTVEVRPVAGQLRLPLCAPLAGL